MFTDANAECMAIPEVDPNPTKAMYTAHSTPPNRDPVAPQEAVHLRSCRWAWSPRAVGGEDGTFEAVGNP